MILRDYFAVTSRTGKHSDKPLHRRVVFQNKVLGASPRRIMVSVANQESLREDRGGLSSVARLCPRPRNIRTRWVGFSLIDCRI